MPILKHLAEKLSNDSKRQYRDIDAIPIRQHGYETPLFIFPDDHGDILYGLALAHDIEQNIPVCVLP